jgi:phosphoribosylformylglycinamidine cyclo-ligase
LHTNGYSLARKVLFDLADLSPSTFIDELGGDIAAALLRVHRSYLPILRGLLPDGILHGLAHITGGGLTDNVPRILPAGLEARIFKLIGRLGEIEERELLRTFNMGVGMVLVVAPTALPRIQSHLAVLGEECFVIGSVGRGSGGVVYE